MNDYVNTLRLRSQKKIARELQKGIIFWEPEMNYFIDAEGKEITGLHFKDKGFDMFGEQQFDEEEVLSDEDN